MLKKRRSLLFLLFMIFASCNAQNEALKELKVKEIIADKSVTLAQVSELLEEQTELQSIDVINWETFPYLPEVNFRVAHCNNQIWLKFYVKEEHILAKRTETNSATHRDSCVEFFLDPEKDGNYYNFEFNCIGVTHCAYGPNVRERKFIDAKLIEDKILTRSSLGNQPFEERGGGHEWEMTVVIPAEILVHEKNIQLKGLNANANFYKCADDTASKHYLSWNPVETERPNFHQPTFFGNLIFD